ncbi:MAG: hypothetical protein HYT87_03760 [Nitrospirae bacterium]|nr:hypothetical protein [Nitrospirota bacterium]
MRRAVFLPVMVCLACSSGANSPRSAPTIEALLGGTSMKDTPWPSDVFLQDGHILVESIPLDGQRGPLDALALTLSEMDGAPVYGSVFFPVSGDLEDGAVPGKATWIDLDAPDRTFETGLWIRARTGDLVALAPRGETLTAGHRYAVWVESPRVDPSPAMRDAIEGRGPFAAIYAPLVRTVPRGTIGAATVFTVGHPTTRVDLMREVAAGLVPPVAKVSRVLRGAELDAFAGTPATTRPGLGDPKGIVHDSLGAIVLGTFDAPSFLSSTPPRLGRVEVDTQGIPIIKGTEAIPFLLALPKDPAALGGLPILIYQHGLNAGRSQVLSCANTYARAGYATIGVDAIWHGDRAGEKTDAVHNFSGAPGPDGLADANDFGASVNLFDFAGDPEQGIGPFDGRYVRDNFRQAIIDLTELARLLRHGDLSAIAKSSPAFAGLDFDTRHIVYTSESFGSVLGASVVTVSPDLAGAVLSVAGGGVFLPMYSASPLFAGMLSPFIRSIFDPYIDVSDPASLPAEAQRSLSLLDAAISPGDPLSFAPLIAERKRNVLVLQARSDELIPNQATELLARAMGATFVTLPSMSEPLRFVDLPTLRAPYQAGIGENTIAVVQIAPALHTMFSSFIGDRRYQPDFPPFISLSQPERVDNPIEMVQDLAVAFVESLRAGGPGRVQAPSRRADTRVGTTLPSAPLPSPTPP